jgi:NTP pyrophosphatase (non-canonical NTP hydrolase)
MNKDRMLRFKDLEQLQVILKAWLEHNFPGATSDQQFKGIVEEVGELARADLKHKQGIRGFTPEKALFMKKDAIGDIVVFLINYCNTENINFQECLTIAIEEVFKRDWIKYPETGVKID